jgi:phosphatidylinositol glycan class U
VPDLTPNVGLFWYFFIEVFKEFKGFFLFVFQYSMLVCPLALSLRLRHRPTFLAVLTLGGSRVYIYVDRYREI